MTRKHVLSAFRKAGFPLRKDSEDLYAYRSSCVIVRYRHQSDDTWALTVFAFRGETTEFQTVREALRCVNSRMAMRYVPGNDFALNTGPRGSLRLVGEAA
jgi:hypothetical protein